MDDFVLVEVLEGRNDLREIVLTFHFCQSFPSFDKLVKRMIGANLKQNVNIFMVFEDMFEFYHMGIG